MPDVALSVQISRDDLGLAALDLNDHVSYYISGQNFLGQAVSWDRKQVTSPFMDGSVTTTRTRQMVNDQLSVEVLGSTQVDLQNKLTTLIQAFAQDTFNLQVAFSTATYQWECESADYTVSFQAERWIAQQVLVSFQFPRNPVPILGGI